MKSIVYKQDTEDSILFRIKPFVCKRITQDLTDFIRYTFGYNGSDSKVSEDDEQVCSPAYLIRLYLDLSARSGQTCSHMRQYSPPRD